MEKLKIDMAQSRFVTYQPTSMTVEHGEVTAAESASIRDDLEILRSRFDGLITYSALHGADRIADIAADLGYRVMIVGVWDVSSDTELDLAIAAAKRVPHLVVGISIGNERVFANEASPNSLAQRIREARQRAPELAFGTTEPFHIFLEPRSQHLLSEMDVLFANVHPIHQAWFRGAPVEQSVRFVTNVTERLLEDFCGPVVVKETGIPTAPASRGFSVQLQAEFYRDLSKTFRPTRRSTFSFFSAFDAPWRVNDAMPVAGEYPEEAHWGLYTAERKPKAVINYIRPLAR